MDTVDRIFELVDQKYAEQRFFAADLGTTPSIVSQWRKRKSASYQKHLSKIAAVLGTTVEYLLNGTTAPASPVDASFEDEEILRQIHDSPDMRALFSLTSKATSEDVRKALKIMRITMGLPEELP